MLHFSFYKMPIHLYLPQVSPGYKIYWLMTLMIALLYIHTSNGTETHTSHHTILNKQHIIGHKANGDIFTHSHYLELSKDRPKRDSSIEEINPYGISDVKFTSPVSPLYNDNNTVLIYQKENISWWTEVVANGQYVLTILGFLANIATAITLVKNGSAFSKAILMLLLHQSIIDAIACLLAAFKLGWPQMWMTGVLVIDYMVCYLWHSVKIFSAFICISIYNLITIAYERFLAICYPFKHQNLTPSKVILFIALQHLLAFIILLPTTFQVTMRAIQCYPEIHFQGKLGADLLYFYSFVLFSTNYAIPCAFFFYFYGRIILTFRNRQKQSSLGSAAVIDKAMAELTKTALIVTIIFMITIGFDLWSLLLGRTGVIAAYKVGSVKQYLGLLFLAFNSMANPFVYALLMPAYRRSLQLTFFQCFVSRHPNHQTKTMSSQGE